MLNILCILHQKISRKDKWSQKLMLACGAHFISEEIAHLIFSCCCCAATVQNKVKTKSSADQLGRFIAVRHGHGTHCCNSIAYKGIGKYKVVAGLDSSSQNDGRSS